MTLPRPSVLAGPWIEVYATRDQLEALTKAADEAGAQTWHFFFAEPWNPDGYVLRVNLGLKAWDAYATHLEGLKYHRWDSGPDENQFRSAWPAVAHYFETNSRLALLYQNKRAVLSKLVHCQLNAHGMTSWQEFCWALRYAKGRGLLWWYCESRLGTRHSRLLAKLGRPWHKALWTWELHGRKIDGSEAKA